MRPKGIIYQCVTNDLTFDQRLLKKARVLKSADYDVRLVGRRSKESAPAPEEFRCQRFSCWFNDGPAFYLEFNIRLFFFLLFRRWRGVVANDADTLLGSGLAAGLRSGHLIYDSHELFTEVPELRGRYLKRKLWHLLQKWFVPWSSLQITVGPKLAKHLNHMYGGDFLAIRNMPEEKICSAIMEPRTMIYQGALNIDRGIELAIDAVVALDSWTLWIAGTGPKENELRTIVRDLGLEDRVAFLGRIPPDELHEKTCRAAVGLNMLHGDSLNYYYSLANKFFDYVQAGIPGISMNFPEYQALCNEYNVALLLEDYNAGALVKALRQLEDEAVYDKYRQACHKAAEQWNWEKESGKLVEAYQRLFESGD